MSTRATGNIGENFAIKHILNKNHKILSRNFNSPFGEIDIISCFENSIFIYEVKYRKNLEYGFGDDSITNLKIRKIKMTFDVWISKNPEYKSFNMYLNALIIDPDGKINEFEIL